MQTLPSGPGRTTKERSLSVVLAIDEHGLPIRGPSVEGYSLAVWYGAFGGPVLALDPDPNVTPPGPERILHLSAKRGGVMTMGSGPANGMFLKCVLAEGTSIQVRAWLHDDRQAKWIKLGTAATLTSSSNIGNVGGFAHGNMAGSKIFIQIIANAGSSSLLGVDLC